jgi:hypothetical protein
MINYISMKGFCQKNQIPMSTFKEVMIKAKLSEYVYLSINNTGKRKFLPTHNTDKAGIAQRTNTGKSYNHSSWAYDEAILNNLFNIETDEKIESTNEIVRLLIDNNIDFTEDTPTQVSINGKLFIYLQKYKKLIKFRYKGSTTWYSAKEDTILKKIHELYR